MVLCLGVHPYAHAGGMDGTARLVQVQNKRVLATLVHSEPKAMEGGGAAAPMEQDGEEDDDEGMEEVSVREEASFSVETVGFSKVMNWCATGQPVPVCLFQTEGAT